jgi:hypothetical protein
MVIRSILDGISAFSTRKEARSRIRLTTEAVKANRAAVAAGAVRYAIRPVVGIDQPTRQTAIKRGNGFEMLRSRHATDESGDGTVPRMSATPIEMGEAQAAFAASRHGSIQNADAVLAHLQGILTTPRDLGAVRAVGAPVTLSFDIDGIFSRQEPVQFAVRPSEVGVLLDAIIESTNGSTPRQMATLGPSDDEWLRRELPPMAPSVYRITVSGDPTQVEPVTDVFAVA